MDMFFVKSILTTRLFVLGTSQPAAVEPGSGHAVERVRFFLMNTTEFSQWKLQALANALQKSRDSLGNKFERDNFMLIVILPTKAAEIRLRVKHWGDVLQGLFYILEVYFE